MILIHYKSTKAKQPFTFKLDELIMAQVIESSVVLRFAPFTYTVELENGENALELYNFIVKEWKGL